MRGTSPVAAFLAISVLAFPGFALAQRGAIRGLVQDTDGHPVQGATVTAQHPTAVPGQLTSTTDKSGRFAMIGLSSGRWVFTAEAPGYLDQQGAAFVRSTSTENPPVQFTLGRAETLLPGALSRQIQRDIEAADTLKRAGRYDQAISAYSAILTANPRLTMIGLATADAYRQKVAQTQDPAVLASLYERAIAVYDGVLETDPDSERARIELALTHLQRGDIALARTTMAAVAQSPSSSAAILYNMGEISLSAGDTGEATDMFQRAAERDPSWLRPLLKLGVVASQRGDREEATSLFQRVIDADPGSLEAEDARAYLVDPPR